MIFKSEEPWTWFHIIREGLEEAMEHSGGYVTIGQIHDALRQGIWDLYIVSDGEGEYLGFGIVERMSRANGMWLNVPFAYSKDGLYLQFFSKMNQIAYDEGMNGVKFVSGRKGFERIAEKYGWDFGFREYIVSDFTRGNK
jgi:hypothetical protein